MALTQVMGDFPDAVAASSEVLKIAGRIYPSTAENVALEALLEDGSKAIGETRISRSRSRIKRVRLIPRTCAAAGRGGRRDCGSGRDHARSGIAIHQRGAEPAGEGDPASDPPIAGGETLLRQPDVAAGGDHGFKASDHVKVLHRHAGGKLLDYAVVNMARIPAAMKKLYAREASLEVENDLDAIFKLGVNVIGGKLAGHTGNVRHDPAATASVILKMAAEGRKRRQGLR
jgi:2-phospho-L-lactate transferase/gluconeogenesis factor (CofD/UPF0052 family)